jgi:hypothetical protein
MDDSSCVVFGAAQLSKVDAACRRRGIRSLHLCPLSMSLLINFTKIFSKSSEFFA